MNLCLDAGNTNLKLAYFQGNRQKPVFKEAVELSSIPDISQYLYRSGVKSIKNSIICSTIPKNDKKITSCITRFYGVRPISAEIALNGILATKYKLAQLGQDRKVNIYGLIQQGQLPAVIVSFGTAITVDYVDARGKHKGGLILPGLQMAARAMHEKTQTLPEVELFSARSGFLGLDTRSCLRSGVLNGTAHSMAGILARIKQQHNLRKLYVLGVGGDVKFMTRYHRLFNRISPDHTLQSLNLLLNSFDN